MKCVYCGGDKNIKNMVDMVVQGSNKKVCDDCFRRVYEKVTK